jgi:hypothetical protein
MKVILSVVFLGLITSLAVAQDQPLAPQPTVFMGHQLGESVQQWFSASEEPKRCAEWNRNKFELLDKKADVQFCKVADDLAQGKSGFLSTRQPGDSTLARDRWYFQDGKLVALIGSFLPYDKTLAELRQKYGSETNKRVKLVVHVLSPTYPVFGEKWEMPDGTLIFLLEDSHAVNHADLVISTQSYIDQQASANNPF